MFDSEVVSYSRWLDWNEFSGVLASSHLHFSSLTDTHMKMCCTRTHVDFHKHKRIEQQTHTHQYITYNKNRSMCFLHKFNGQTWTMLVGTVRIGIGIYFFRFAKTLIFFLFDSTSFQLNSHIFFILLRIYFQYRSNFTAFWGTFTIRTIDRKKRFIN